jgi:predicted negative regulator of RcsB-dependent stress response
VAEYLNDDDRVMIIRKWWDENGVALILTVALAIAAVVGWRWYNDYVQTREEAASATYQRYLESRQRGASPEETAALLATIDKDFRRSSYRIFTLFYRAYDAMAADDVAKATEYFDTAAKDASDDHLRDIARLRLARLQQQAGDSDKALATLRSVSGAGFRSYVAELKGDILLAQNKPDEAREAYQAAKAAADPGEQQPVLDMKLVDLAKPNASPAP